MRNLALTVDQWLHNGRSVRKSAVPFATSPTGRPLFRYEDTSPVETAFEQEVLEEVRSWPTWKRKAEEAPFKACSIDPIGGPGKSAIPFNLPDGYTPDPSSRSFLEHLDSLTPQAHALREIEEHLGSVFYKHHGDAFVDELVDGFSDEP